MLSEIFQIIKKNLFLIGVLVLISFLSFQLGRISRSASQPIKIEKANVQEIFGAQNTNLQIKANNTDRGEGKDLKINFLVVASKNSNKYHFLWCPGAKQIKETNKIYFESEAKAIAAGYTLAGNCSK